tara:strand:- start:19800 stop:20195 length:396 start_codon:yes stop_codon:yes gene_type:complete
VGKDTMSPFDFLNSINYTKKDIMTPENEKSYNAFMVNRGLSYFQDTVMYANFMNVHNRLDKRLQYDFFINTIRTRKRFSKWFKPEVEKNVDVIKEYYGYSNEKARIALSLLTPEQLTTLIDKVKKGGRRNS